MRMHSRHQQRLQIEMKQPWSGPVVKTRVGKEAGRVSVLPQVNMSVGRNPRSSEARRACATLCARGWPVLGWVSGAEALAGGIMRKAATIHSPFSLSCSA